ncbi:hypothetical protein B0O80DRAFT_465178, partial [Mortierella sp. GBAus27b]
GTRHGDKNHFQNDQKVSRTLISNHCEKLEWTEHQNIVKLGSHEDVHQLQETNKIHGGCTWRWSRRNSVWGHDWQGVGLPRPRHTSYHT